MIHSICRWFWRIASGKMALHADNCRVVLFVQRESIRTWCVDGMSSLNPQYRNQTCIGFITRRHDHWEIAGHFGNELITGSMQVDFHQCVEAIGRCLTQSHAKPQEPR